MCSFQSESAPFNACNHRPPPSHREFFGQTLSVHPEIARWVGTAVAGWDPKPLSGCGERGAKIVPMEIHQSIINCFSRRYGCEWRRTIRWCAPESLERRWGCRTRRGCPFDAGRDPDDATKKFSVHGGTRNKPGSRNLNVAHVAEQVGSLEGVPSVSARAGERAHILPPNPRVIQSRSSHFIRRAFTPDP